MVKIGWSLASSWMRRKYFWPHCGRCESLAWRVGQAGVDLCRASKGEVFGSSPHICWQPQLQELLPSRKTCKELHCRTVYILSGYLVRHSLDVVGWRRFSEKGSNQSPKLPHPIPMWIPWLDGNTMRLKSILTSTTFMWDRLWSISNDDSQTTHLSEPCDCNQLVWSQP